MDTNTTTKSRELSPGMVKEVQALAGAIKRQAEGKATGEDYKAIATASDAVRREARKAAGISSPRGKHSAVEVFVNGKNGNAVGWEEWYGLKALSDLMGGAVVAHVVPTGNADAKPVSAAKISEFFALLKAENAKGPEGLSPSQVARKVAGK